MGFRVPWLAFRENAQAESCHDPDDSGAEGRDRNISRNPGG